MDLWPPEIPETVESGMTFEENATIKLCRIENMPRPGGRRLGPGSGRADGARAFFGALRMGERDRQPNVLKLLRELALEMWRTSNERRAFVVIAGSGR